MEQFIEISVPKRETIRITTKKGDEVLDEREIPYEGAVDSRLLTELDKLFNEHILDQFAQYSVKPGPGIDKTSLLYRIVLTLDAALSASRRSA